MRVFKDCARRWPRIVLTMWTLLWLTCLIGCSKRLVIIDGTETITVKKATLDRLYRDNAALLHALEQCEARAYP